MQTESTTRRYLPGFLWGAVILSIVYVFFAFIAPNSAGISLGWDDIKNRTIELFGFTLLILISIALVEVYFFQVFFRKPKNSVTNVIVRILQVIMALLAIFGIIYFLELTDLIRLGDGTLAAIVRAPFQWYQAFNAAVVEAFSGGKGSNLGGYLLILAIIAIYVVIHLLTVKRNSKYGLAYLLVMPAFLGMAFLIIYPFMFEIKLAFSNASLGTQATKNASYGLIYGWNNLVTLFTGNVAKEAGFFEVLLRTVLWTVINVVFHVLGGLGLALLLNRPMKLQGLYRTLLIFPWAVPSTIAILALRNEFDSRYGMFNIILGRIQDWLTGIATSTNAIIGIGTLFAWLAATIGPVSWKQDPTWAFVSVLIANIWLGIPFMMVILLGGLQSISQEYYEAAEIDGANTWQKFRNITLPLIQPVMTPAVVLGFVWTFNKFEVIYLITQGGPQEKTDILVSSMYKAAFQFYRYGFTAMFALVIFFMLLLFTIFYLRVTGGLKNSMD